MSETTFSITALTDEAIADATTSQLREWATLAGLQNYSTRTNVLDLKLGADVLGHPGALTAVDRLVTILKAAYADREPLVDTRYGDAFTLQVWSEDESLRQALRYHRDRENKSE